MLEFKRIGAGTVRFKLRGCRGRDVFGNRPNGFPEKVLSRFKSLLLAILTNTLLPTCSEHGRLFDERLKPGFERIGTAHVRERESHQYLGCQCEYARESSFVGRSLT